MTVDTTNNLITVIKQRLTYGQDRDQIADDLKSAVSMEEIFLAYHAALILFNKEAEFYDDKK